MVAVSSLSPVRVMKKTQHNVGFDPLRHVVEWVSMSMTDQQNVGFDPLRHVVEWVSMSMTDQHNVGFDPLRHVVGIGSNVNDRPA